MVHRLRGIGVKTGSPLAIELNNAGINARTAPGLFSKNGADGWDNLPANEWSDISHAIGEDENGYLSEQGLIDALTDEFAGIPMQNREQQELQAAINAQEAADRFEDAAPMEQVWDIRAPFIDGPDQDMRTPAERREDVVGIVNEYFETTNEEIYLTPEMHLEIIDALDNNGGYLEDVLSVLEHREASYYDGPSESEIPFPELFGTNAGNVSTETTRTPSGPKSEPVSGQAETRGNGTETNGPLRSNTAENGQVDLTPEGEQLVIPGAEQITDKARAERSMDTPMRGSNAEVQEDGLFGGSQRNDLFDAAPSTPVTSREEQQGADDRPHKLEASTTEEITLEDYSEKSFVVRGVSKEDGPALFDGLKAKAAWNSKANAWAFSKKRRDEVQARVDEKPANSTPLPDNASPAEIEDHESGQGNTQEQFKLADLLTKPEKAALGRLRGTDAGDTMSELDSYARRAAYAANKSGKSIDDVLTGDHGEIGQGGRMLIDTRNAVQNILAAAKKDRSGDAVKGSRVLDAIQEANDFMEMFEQSGIPVSTHEANDSWSASRDIPEMARDQIFPDPAKTVNLDLEVKKDGFIPIDEASARLDAWKAEAKRLGKTGVNKNKVVISLFDYTGQWSQPWRDAGYQVIQHDIKTGSDILLDEFMWNQVEEMRQEGLEIYGVLSACPCTTYAGSGARWWESLHDKESPETLAKVFGDNALVTGAKSALEYNNMLVDATRDMVAKANPSGFHVLENPIGRIQKETGLPKPTMRFHPHNFADPYTKRTQLFGDFDTDLPTANVDPVEGSKMQSKLRGSDPQGKEDRSTTPEGFSYAFFMANDPAAKDVTPEVADGQAETKAPTNGEIHAAAKEADRNPTDGQKEAGNYKLGHINFQGLDVSMENAKGSTRSGKDGNGKAWSVKMPAHYGYIKRTEGADGDHVDVYIGPSPNSQFVQIVDQLDADTGKFDEHKVILGSTGKNTRERGLIAKALYSRGFSDGRGEQRIGDITEMPIHEFREWLENGSQKKPANGQEKKGGRIGANSKGQLLNEDENGVRSYTQRGVTVSEAVQIVPGKGAYVDPSKRGRDYLTAEEYKATQPKADGPRVFVNKVGRDGKTDAERGGKLYDDGIIIRDAAESARSEWNLGRYTVIAERETPFKVERGYGETPEAAVSNAIHLLTGKKPVEDKTQSRNEPVETKAEKPKKAKSADYGSKNQLVSKDRAAVLRARLKDKLSSQINAGIDPEIVAIGMELTVFHIEAGARKFTDAAKALAEDLDVELSEIRKYLRAWYNGARDMMEDSGVDVEGMSATDEVVDEIKALFTPTTEAIPEAAPIAKTAKDATLPVERDLFDDIRDNERDDRASAGESAEAPKSENVREVRAGSGNAGDGGSRVAARGRSEESGTPSNDRGNRATQRDQGSRERPDGLANHVIGQGELEPAKGAKTRARQSIEAIRLLKEIEGEARTATADERAVLAKFGGAGTLAGGLKRSDGTYPMPDIAKELLEVTTPEEYETIERTSQYAFYTAEPVLRAMWHAAKKLGFKGGKVYEPGMGVGGFTGTIPTDIAAKTTYQGLELDSLTARIAKLLYPKSVIQHGDFIKTPLAQGHYDLVIGNPPFAGTKIKADPDYPQGFMLHDYFFAKSLDAVRPGGLLMFVTSAGTMNKGGTAARDYLADRADLVGSIRLPSTAFKDFAGTEVTTDIVILRKRLEGETEADKSWRGAELVEMTDKEGGTGQALVNNYFVQNPDMILGEQGLFDKLIAGPRLGVRARPDSDFVGDLATAVGKLTTNVMSAPTQSQKLGAVDVESVERKAGGYYMKDGKLFQFDGKQGAPVQARSKTNTKRMPAGHVEKVKALVGIKMALREVYAADTSGKDATAARKTLNKTYDAFVKAHGPINKVTRLERRPTVVQQETARQRAHEDARMVGESFDIGSFNPSGMLDTGASMVEIARSRKLARERDGYREGTFNPDAMPSTFLEKHPNIDPFMDDQEGYRLRAIEKYDDKTGAASKSQIFTE